MIAVRETDPKKEDRSAGEKFYPPEMAFPLTAFLVPNSRLRDASENVDEARECTLELIDPVAAPLRSARPPTRCALETDLTTPLAYMWSRTDLDRYRWTGLLRPEQALERANLMLIRPYEPGKIPVVMVHGLISSPLAWIPMLNELLRDPAIQDEVPVHALHVPDRRADPDRRRRPARLARPGQDDVQPRRPRPGVRPDGPARPQHGRAAQPPHGGRQRRPALAAQLRPVVRRDPRPAQGPRRAPQAALLQAPAVRQAGSSSWPRRTAARTCRAGSSAASARA